MHMLSRKDLNSAELETVRVSKSPTTVVTANGEVLFKLSHTYISNTSTAGSTGSYIASRINKKWEYE